MRKLASRGGRPELGGGNGLPGGRSQDGLQLCGDRLGSGAVVVVKAQAKHSRRGTRHERHERQPNRRFHAPRMRPPEPLRKGRAETAPRGRTADYIAGAQASKIASNSSSQLLLYMSNSSQESAAPQLK